MKAPAVGIDLGTSYCRIAVWKEDKVEIIPNEIGEQEMPSFITITKNNERLVGTTAQNYRIHKPENTLFSIKRLIKRDYGDIYEKLKFYPFKIIRDQKFSLIQINEGKEIKNYCIEEVLSILLQKLKQIATDYLGKEVKDAIITVPTYFNDSQRQAVKDAGTIAGLNCLRLIVDSTAACIGYYIKKNKEIENEPNVLIFDFGGGSLNISILSLEDGLFEVRAVNGDNYLGGEDFDIKLMEYCINEFKKKYNIDILSSPKALNQLRIKCEEAKIELSYNNETNICINNLIKGLNLYLNITRDKFEELCNDFFKKIIVYLEYILKDSKLNKNQINDIILMGGSSRIPKVQAIYKKFF